MIGNFWAKRNILVYFVLSVPLPPCSKNVPAPLN